jgi:hypothetical protein
VVAKEVKSVSHRITDISHEMSKDLAGSISELNKVGLTMMVQLEEAKGKRLKDLALNMIDIIDRNLYERSCDVRWWATDGAVVEALQDVDPQIAKRYGLQPSAGRGLLTLVLNRQPNATPVEATFSAEVRSLTGVLREAPLRRVEEAGAVSYLAEFATPQREILVFHVTAQLNDGAHLEASFRREMFAN